ncbi:MAG: serine--tRNA ligase [Actinobacteria bacterium]|nr:serine--tRNA ligase [Actinomycetota bacterium]
MIDLKAARNDPDAYRAALVRKGAGEAFDALLAADERWRELVPRVDELRSQTKLKGKPTPEQLAELQGVKEQLRAAEEELAAAEAARDEALAQVPNPPHESSPDGNTDEDAVELRRVGEPPALAEAREHTEIGRFDMERAARVSGARFGYLIGDTALLAFALYRAALDHLSQAGFLPVIPPVLVREEAMTGTGFFPTERSNIYALADDDLFLTGTSEVALAGLHMGEILDAAELQLRYAGFSTNFRREAGAAGKDTRGMFRVHQFNKVEMFVYTTPEESWAEHDRLVELEEAFLQSLGLPYRAVNVAAGDLGAPAAKKVDLEAWFPSQERYREVTSCSNTTDYQARRLGVRHRGEGGGPQPVHTLNGTMVTDRTLLAVLENFGGEVPDVLRPFGAPEHIER